MIRFTREGGGDRELRGRKGARGRGVE